MTKLRFLVLVGIGSLSFLNSSLAFSQESACLMEGTVTFGDVVMDIKDCLQNNGIPQDRFKETCNSLAQGAAALGGPPAKITYMAACPSQPQGSCVGFFGQPMTSFYYKRETNSLPSVKSSCEAQGGKWE